MNSTSKLGKLNGFDFVKTVIIIIGSSILGSLVPILQTGQMPTRENLSLIFGVAISAGITYLMKQLGTNEKGELLKKEG